MRKGARASAEGSEGECGRERGRVRKRERASAEEIEGECGREIG